MRPEQLTEHNPHAAAQAFSAIACDQTVNDETRLAAAEQLAAIDPQAAAPACLAIASNKMVTTRCAWAPLSNSPASIRWRRPGLPGHR